MSADPIRQFNAPVDLFSILRVLPAGNRNNNNAAANRAVAPGNVNLNNAGIDFIPRRRTHSPEGDLLDHHRPHSQSPPANRDAQQGQDAQQDQAAPQGQDAQQGQAPPGPVLLPPSANQALNLFTVETRRLARVRGFRDRVFVVVTIRGTIFVFDADAPNYRANDHRTRSFERYCDNSLQDEATVTLKFCRTNFRVINALAGIACDHHRDHVYRNSRLAAELRLAGLNVDSRLDEALAVFFIHIVDEIVANAEADYRRPSIWKEMMDFIFFPTKDVLSFFRTQRRSFLDFYKLLCTLLFALEILRCDRGAGCPDDLPGTGCPKAFKYVSTTITKCFATAHIFLSGGDVQDTDVLKLFGDVNKDRNMANPGEDRADDSANDFVDKVGRITYPLCFPGSSAPATSAAAKTPARKSKKPSGSNPAAKKRELSHGEKQALRQQAESLMKADVQYPKGMFGRLIKQLESTWPRSKNVPPTSAVGQEMAAAEAEPREAGANYKKKNNRGADAPAGGN